MKMLVLVPSRLKRKQAGGLFLSEAMHSIAGQKIPSDFDVRVEISIGVDPGGVLPGDLSMPANATVSEAASASQAFALNAAAARFDHDFVAILEDDDQWLPSFLHASLLALHQNELDFVSTTQLQTDESGKIVSINDFPIPSGWVMRRTVWQTVGPFDTTFKYHLDNEWLGRLALRGFRRGHLVEATAPIDANWMAVRPWLRNVLNYGGPHSTLLRHGSPIPLVTRMVHAGSGTSALRADPGARATSQREYGRLVETFGRIPW